MTNLNPFSHLIKFTCVIFHIFFKVVQLLCHGTHCSGHTIYAYGSIMCCLVNYPNGLALIVYYNNQETATNLTFWRTLAKFWYFDAQPILVIKTFYVFIFPFSKVLHWNYCLWRNENNFLIKGMMGWVPILTRRLIPNNTKKFFMKYHNRSSKNPFQLRVVHDPYLMNKQIIDRQLQLLWFCLYIVKGWRDTPVNLIWNLEDPVGKVLYTSCVIIQGSENTSKYGMKTLGLPPIMKYEIIHWKVSLSNSIKFIFFWRCY